MAEEELKAFFERKFKCKDFPEDAIPMLHVAVYRDNKEMQYVIDVAKEESTEMVATVISGLREYLQRTFELITEESSTGH